MVKVFGIVSKAKVDIFLELSCFFDDPANVCNLISGSSACWQFDVEVLGSCAIEAWLGEL